MKWLKYNLKPTFEGADLLFELEMFFEKKLTVLSPLLTLFLYGGEKIQHKHRRSLNQNKNLVVEKNYLNQNVRYVSIKTIRGPAKAGGKYLCLISNKFAMLMRHEKCDFKN